MARTFGPYQGVLAEAVRQLKYRERTRLAAALVAKEGVTTWPDLWRVDFLVPVPLHPLRLRKRGFNQAGRLAQALGRRLGMPTEERSLVRRVPTPPQVGLGRRARFRNMGRAFDLRSPERVAGRTVLLVDDVITTGATMNACARVLKQAGAVRVHAWALARQDVG